MPRHSFLLSLSILETHIQSVVVASGDFMNAWPALVVHWQEKILESLERPDFPHRGLFFSPRQHSQRELNLLWAPQVIT